MSSAGTRGDVVLVATLASWNLLQNLVVPRRWYGATNAVGTSIAYGAARACGLGDTELGLGPGAVRRGLRAAALPSSLAVALTAAATAGPYRGLFRDDRVVRTSFRRLVFEAGFQIPVGTAVFEEFVFRGLLPAWLARTRGARAADGAAGALFGLWHILPTWHAAGLRVGTSVGSAGRRTVAVVAGVGATALAAAVLLFVRRRADSLVAPIAIHAVVNSAGYVAAWLEAGDRRGAAGERDRR